MVQTITPVVHGGSRRRWVVSLSLHVLGATASAAAFGALLGGVGTLLGAPWGRSGMSLVAAIGVVYAAREIFGLPIPLPELRRQVPEWWRGALGARTSSFLYGLALGPGVGTHLRHGTFVAISATLVAMGDPIVGIAALGAFGFARAVGVAVVSGARTPVAVGDVGDRLERIGASALPRIANAVALIAIVAVALGSTPRGDAPPAWLWTAALAVTFAWAAAAKLLLRAAWRDALRAHALPAWIEGPAERAVPLLEAGVLVLLLAGYVRAGAALAALLLTAFSLELVRTRQAGGGRVPCGCFGGRSQRSIRWLVTRNAILLVIAAGSFVVRSPPPLPTWPGMEDLLPATLVAVGGGLAGWLVLRAVSLTRSERVRP
jgi:Methylamine utilisation protein MauE